MPSSSISRRGTTSRGAGCRAIQWRPPGCNSGSQWRLGNWPMGPRWPGSRSCSAPDSILSVRRRLAGSSATSLIAIWSNGGSWSAIRRPSRILQCTPTPRTRRRAACRLILMSMCAPGLRASRRCKALSRCGDRRRPSKCDRNGSTSWQRSAVRRRPTTSGANGATIRCPV